MPGFGPRLATRATEAGPTRSAGRASDHQHGDRRGRRAAGGRRDWACQREVRRQPGPRRPGRRRRQPLRLVDRHRHVRGRAQHRGQRLEDLGWYVVDNLPPERAARRLAERGRRSGDSTRLAVVARRPQPLVLRRPADAVRRARRRRHRRPRSSSSRPPTTCSSAGTRRSAARTRCRATAGCSTASPASASCCATCAADADLVSTPPTLNVHQLRAKDRRGVRRRRRHRLRVTVMSVRLQVRPAARRRPGRRLPLPAQPALGARAAAADRPERPVSDYVLGQPGAEEFLDALRAAARASSPPATCSEGKRFATIAIGCTGGKHRSIAIAEELARRLRAPARRPPSAPRPGARMTGS